MEYKTKHETRLEEFNRFVGHLDYDIVFADWDHEDAENSDIIIMDCPIEQVSKEEHQLLVTYPFILTDLLNAISLYLNHYQLAELSNVLPLDIATENFEMLRELFYRLNVRRVDAIPGLRVESRYNYGSGGYVDQIVYRHEDSLWLISLSCASSFRLSRYVTEVLYTAPANKDYFNHVMTEISNLKKDSEKFDMGLVLYDEDTGKLEIKNTDGVQVIKDVSGYPVSILSFGAKQLKEEHGIPETDLLEFSFQASRDNFIHDVTILNFFEKKEETKRFKIVC